MPAFISSRFDDLDRERTDGELDRPCRRPGRPSHVS